MESIKNLKFILDSAPEGATHIDGDNYYIRKLNKNWLEYWWNGYWNKLEEELLPTRSLEDIRTIIELYETLSQLNEFNYTVDSFEWESKKENLLERFE